MSWHQTAWLGTFLCLWNVIPVWASKSVTTIQWKKSWNSLDNLSVSKQTQPSQNVVEDIHRMQQILS